MPFHSLLLFFFCSLSPFSIPSPANAISFVAPIDKDNSTLLYSLTLYLKTPLQPTRLHLDLGASFTWVDCYTDYNSSTYQHIPCGSPLCSSIGHDLACSNCSSPPGPPCANNTCSLFPENSVTRKTAISNALSDSLALPTSNGLTQGPPILFPSYVFSCSPPSLLDGLANNVTGLAAFGRSNFSLPVQVSDTFSVPRSFALCLPGSMSANPGVALIGSVGPYYFSSQKIDISKSLVFTPLILNPVGSTVITYAGKPSDEYYINATSINVNGKPIQINSSLLTIDENGFGGTKLSTATPYTILETSIYNAVTDAFVNESSTLNLTVTNAVKPFSVCFSAADIVVTRVGPGVPTIDLVMQSDDVFWRVFGSNSMVRIAGNGGDIWCLGFVDGGVNPRTSVVIGGHQMEDNLLQFDLDSTRLGFTSSVLLKGTTCSNFNFGSKG